MAREELVISDLTLPGADDTNKVTSTADGVSFVNSGDIALKVDNTGAGTNSITIKAGGNLISGASFADEVVSISAGSFRILGNMSPSIFNTTGGLTEVDSDASNPTEIDFTAYRLTRR